MAAAPLASENEKPASITDLPWPGQTILHNGTEYTTIKEGLAHILIPPNAALSTDPRTFKQQPAEQTQQVFYNPIQQFNRDLSVLAIRAFGEDLLAIRQRKSEKRGNKPGFKEKQQKRSARRKLAQATAPEEGAAEGTIEGVNGVKRRRVDESGTLAGNVEMVDITAKEPEARQPVADKEVPAASAEDDVVGEEGINDSDLLALEKSLDKGVISHGEQAVHAGTGSSTVEDPGGRPGVPMSRSHFKILDALSATGLRALRYAQEIPFITSVTANDLSEKATASIALNVKHNRLEDKIVPMTSNAIAHMYSFVGQEPAGGPGPKYDVIDLDPYGTAVPFLDAAVQALNDGGLLCVTCTDAAVFASTGYLEKTYSQYGGLPIKGYHSHEGGLRLILHAIATSAARYGLAIEPLLSLSIDFYARVFVRVRKSAADVKFLAGKTMLVYGCDAGCGAWTTQFLGRNTTYESKKGQTLWKYSLAQAPSASPHCAHCGFKTHISGPMYGGPLHNPAFIEKILSFLPELDRSTYETTERIEGMLRTAYDETLFDSSQSSAPSVLNTPKVEGGKAPELPLPSVPAHEIDHHPFFFSSSHLAGVLHCQSPPEAAIKGALRHAGYRATRSHAKPGVIKTDAGWDVVWEIMREWVRQKAPLKEGSLRKGMAGWGILYGRDGSKKSLEKGVVGKEKEADGVDVENADGKPEQNGRGAGGGKAAVGDGAGVPDAVEHAVEHAEAGVGTGVAAEADADAAAKSGEDAAEVKSASGTKLKVVFDEKLGKDRESRNLVRYQLNPRPNWGPMNRAR
ncbi:RNA methyltransferase tRNA(m5U54)methyltransferase [Coniosporium tulheliwenetii]|uniref:RNA methyltransferase tRNA(M5U54)methyltransferase n=1 Tax=Coniosporium tulheliwenetii TaxID=3383036 RepID=A0ACC2ZED0_9PEZI|nr:RNA methyltransferase tRNA(m5U54)methyltransferase [Cladosporium sp. JES 115]